MQVVVLERAVQRSEWPAVLCVLVLVAAGPALPALGGEGSGEGGAAWREEHFPIAAPAEAKVWVGPAIDPAEWRPVDQPDLAKALEAAPALRIEDVAPPPERCWVGHRPYLVPNPDGKSWDMVYPYYNKYRGEQEVVIHDFGTGKTGRQTLSTRKGDEVLTREPIGFHMKPSFYTAGKLVFPMYGPVLFVVYDPAEDRFVHGTKPFGDDVVHGRCVLGMDGRIYGIGWPRDRSGFVAYRFDPKTYEAKRYGPFGPPNAHRRELYARAMMSGDWIYAAIGAKPWHLVAFNVRTGQGRLLATTQEILGDSGTIRFDRMKGGVSGTIREAASIEGLTGFDTKEFAFWLHDGKIHQCEGEVPPWSDRPAEPHRDKRHAWAREFQAWPADFTPPSPPPEIKRDAGAPDGRGRVELPYRLAGQAQWSTLAYGVRMYPGVVRLLTEVAPHVLFATDEGYGQHVFYDLKARRILRVGGTLSPYSMGLLGTRLYVSGYPSSQMYEYDLARPIGLRREQPNPRRLGYVASKNDTHCPLAGTIGGADGRVYCAGVTYGRRREGGGFGWYDTKTGQIGGMPIDGHRIFWMTVAEGGRYLLLSSKLGENGELFCWDTRSHEMAYRKRLLGGGRPGPIVEALPGGLILGHHDKGVLYGLRADTGEVLWQKPVPAGPVTAFGSVRRHAYAFRRGPDGRIWSFFGKVLVRIDPRTARVEPVGRVPTDPAQIAFADGRVYLAGSDRLRQLKGLRVPDPRPNAAGPAH